MPHQFVVELCSQGNSFGEIDIHRKQYTLSSLNTQYSFSIENERFSRGVVDNFPNSYLKARFFICQTKIYGFLNEFRQKFVWAAWFTASKKQPGKKHMRSSVNLKQNWPKRIVTGCTYWESINTINQFKFFPWQEVWFFFQCTLLPIPPLSRK